MNQAIHSLGGITIEAGGAVAPSRWHFCRGR